MKSICFFNQKGGVGKTTSVINIAAALGQLGYTVLVVDMDPQGNGTSGFGVDKNDLEHTVYDWLISGYDEAVILKTEEKNVSLVPANADLAGASVDLQNLEEKEYRLAKALACCRGFDFCLIDCPPSLGILSLNSLMAASSCLIPMQAEYYALEGITQLMQTVSLIREDLGHDLEIEGILLTMYDKRMNLSREVLYEIERFFGDKVYQTKIPRNVRLAEAPSFGQSILKHDPISKGAFSYKKVAKEIIAHHRKG